MSLLKFLPVSWVSSGDSRKDPEEYQNVSLVYSSGGSLCTGSPGSTDSEGSGPRSVYSLLRRVYWSRGLGGLMFTDSLGFVLDGVPRVNWEPKFSSYLHTTKFGDKTR